MKQVLQNFRTGELRVEDVPAPMVRSGGVLVRNRFSLISAGTERATVEVAQSGLLGKAQKRPDLVRQALENVRREGVIATYAKVKSRLATLKPLGYSCAGEVIETGCPEVFEKGERVACAGGEYAHHAEYIFVPKNLCARVPDNVSFEEAAYATLGAIALQGVRQAEPRIGETVAVIGLGLLGQLTAQILEANGCNAIGFDLDEDHVALALVSGATAAFVRRHTHLEENLRELTAGRGCDAVIITAATKSNDPIELAGRIARKKGRIVIVGLVSLDIPRSPFYEKELDVRMSCSYGPGRYDAQYEAHGLDYPFAYVRWTEKRNVEAFLQLLSKGKVNVEAMTTHRFDIGQATEAYDLILGKRREKYLGVLLSYPGDNSALVRTVPCERHQDNSHNEDQKPTKETANREFTRINANGKNGVNRSPLPFGLILPKRPRSRTTTTKTRVGFIGAGNFAQSYRLPYLKRASGIELLGVATLNAANAKHVGDKFGFRYCSTDYQQIVQDNDIDTVFIATRHDLHAEIAVAALNAGKHVFVEKPPAINSEQLSDLMHAYERADNCRLAIGYNRKYAPLALKMKTHFVKVSQPLVVNYRVNAGYLDPAHWLHHPEIGGGRIIGEVCHFVDLAQFFIGSRPVSVFAESLAANSEEPIMTDNITANIRFENGGMANITYISGGSNRMPKERVEILGGGMCAVIDNFSSGVYYSDKVEKIKKPGKGYEEEIRAFLNAEEERNEQDLFYPSAVTFEILESIRTRGPRPVMLEPASSALKISNG